MASYPARFTVTLAQICDGIESTLGAAASLRMSQSYDELTESIPTVPLLQVYWDSLAHPTEDMATERSTSEAGVRITDLTFFADLYVAQRSGNIDFEMGELLPVTDEIVDILDAQRSGTVFGVAGIKAIAWSAQRQVFEYGEGRGMVRFMGTRFTIRVRLF